MIRWLLVFILFVGPAYAAGSFDPVGPPTSLAYPIGPGSSSPLGPGTPISLGNAPIPTGPPAFATNGDSQPIEGFPTFPQAFYDATANKTWFAWGGSPDGSTRNAYAATYNHSSGLWCPGQSTTINGGCTGSGSVADGYLIGSNPDTSSHGPPAIAMDQYGYVHAFWGSHVTNLKYSVTANSRDPSTWTSCTALSAVGYTYAQPVLVAGKIVLLSTQTPGSAQDLIVQIGTPSSNGGCITFGAVIQISSVTSGFLWTGNAVASGNNVCFAYTYGDAGPTYLNHAFYSCYNIITGALCDVTLTTTCIASGSLPASLATLEADFEVFQTPSTSDATIIPSQALDLSGNPHLIYANGAISSEPAGTFTLFEASFSAPIGSSGTWTTGTSLGVSVSNFFANAALVATSAGFEVFYPSGSNPVNLNVISRTFAGSWGSATSVKNQNVWNVGGASMVFNGPSQARVIFNEYSTGVESASNVYGSLQMFAYGDQGFVNAPFVFQSANLLGYWTFDSSQCSGTTANDSSGNGNNATLGGGLSCSGSLVTGQIGQALNTTSTSNTVTFPASSVIQPTSVPVTLSGWWKPSSLPSATLMFSTSLFTTHDAGVNFEGGTGALVCFYGNDAGADWGVFTADSLLSTGTWYYVTIALTGSTSCTIYINTFPQSTTSFGASTTIANAGAPVIATQGDGATIQLGDVDDLRLYSTFAPWQMSQTYQQGLLGHQ